VIRNALRRLSLTRALRVCNGFVMLYDVYLHLKPFRWDSVIRNALRRLFLIWKLSDVWFVRDAPRQPDPLFSPFTFHLILILFLWLDLLKLPLRWNPHLLRLNCQSPQISHKYMCIYVLYFVLYFMCMCWFMSMSRT